MTKLTVRFIIYRVLIITFIIAPEDSGDYEDFYPTSEDTDLPEVPM